MSSLLAQLALELPEQLVEGQRLLTWKLPEQVELGQGIPAVELEDGELNADDPAEPRGTALRLRVRSVLLCRRQAKRGAGRLTRPALCSL